MKGNLTRRGVRSWRLKYDLAPGPNGKRETKYATLKGTRAQAQSAAAAIIASIGAGTHVDSSALTVGQFIERWLDSVRDRVGNRTLDRYSELLRRHVGARVGDVPIQKLTAGDLMMVYAAMAQGRPRRSHPAPCAPRRAHHAAEHDAERVWPPLQSRRRRSHQCGDRGRVQ